MALSFLPHFLQEEEWGFFISGVCAFNTLLIEVQKEENIIANHFYHLHGVTGKCPNHVSSSRKMCRRRKANA
jgi:hypothetical protein